MKPLTVSQPIAAPPERVFALATDLAGAAERITGIDSVELLSGEGPFGVGTRWRETRTLMGREATEEMWVTAFEPGRSYTAEAESNGCHYVTTLTCASAGDGTLASIRFRGEPTSLGSRVMLTLMAPLTWWMTKMVRRCLEEDLADLRAAAECDGH